MDDFGKQDHVKNCNLEIRKRPTYEIVNEDRRINNNTIQNYPNALVVTRVLKRGFRIPEQTRERHIYDGPFPFTGSRAIEVSTNRSENISCNTVFNNPYEFLECDTLFGTLFETLIISAKPVQTYQCTRSDGQWTAASCGKVHAVFSMNGNHFPGEQYLFGRVVFPN